MALRIDTKKPLSDYAETEQQAILSSGQAILAEKLEQGQHRSKEDTFCMLAFLRSQREIKFKPTVEKIIKEKPLTKAQKLELLKESISLEVLTDKHKLVIEEFVGVEKEYILLTSLGAGKELIKLTKTNIKNKVKELSGQFYERTESEQEFLNYFKKEG